MKYLIKISFTVLVLTLVFSSCKKDEDNEVTTTSTEPGLFDLSKSNSGYLYYQNGALLPGTSPSPHGSFKLRFNDIAHAALDTAGKLPVGSSFPENSIIVKELHTDGVIKLLAVMQKKAADANAGSGWVWAEYNLDGTEVYSVSKKGAACIGCHSTTKTRDLVKTFDLH